MSFRRFSLLLSVLGVFGGAATLLPACRTPDLCVGGLVTADGGCVAKCDASKCLPGNTCVGNACVLKCTSHLQCNVGTQACLPANEDFTDAGVLTCQAQDSLGVGKLCATDSDCGADGGTDGLSCLTVGTGDATAYCTSDCLGDSDCPGGYECGWRGTSRLLCGVDAGPSPRCGAPTDPCLPASQLGVPGSVWSQGHYCLERRTCFKRKTCSACTSNVDCSVSGKICTTIPVDAGSVCAATCGVDSDCGADKWCVNGACLPRFPFDGGPQACLGAGFCEPCRYSNDCAPGFGCSQLKAEERSCIDRDFNARCTTDTDCPQAPSGLHGLCLDNRVQIAPADPLYHRCYAPYAADNNVFSCYPQPPAP